jgi:hypothetical protein
MTKDQTIRFLFHETTLPATKAMAAASMLAGVTKRRLRKWVDLAIASGKVSDMERAESLKAVRGR